MELHTHSHLKRLQADRHQLSNSLSSVNKLKHDLGLFTTTITCANGILKREPVTHSLTGEEKRVAVHL